MNRHILVKIFLFIVVFVFNACSDEPNATGFGLIPESDLISTDVFDTDSMYVNITSATYNDSIDLSSSERLLIGKTSFAKASAFVRFYPVLPDSILNQILKDSIIVRNCFVKIVPNYKIGSGYFDFNLYKIKQSWSSSTINNKNYTSLPVDKTQDFSYNKVITDTLITFNIKNTLANSWLLNKADTTKGENFGVMFSPTENSDKIIGIPGLNYYYNYKNFEIYIEVEKIGKYIDTVMAYATEDLHVVDVNSPTSNNNNLFLIAGDPYRSKIHFDLSMLPKNVVINKAVLTLTVDENESYIGTPASDTVFAIILNDSTTNTINKYYNIGYLLKNNNTYIGNVTSIVQLWVDGISNQGLRLNLSNETSTVNKIAIKSEKSVGFKPKLKIYYTKQR